MKKLLFVLLQVLCANAHAQENPGWSVNAAAFQFTMNVTGEVFIDSLPPAPAGYWLGAFVGAQCRGVAQAQLAEGNWRYFLTVYANQETGEQISFKLYYHPLEATLTASNRATFLSNDVLGTLDKPFALYVPLYNDRPPFLSNIPDQEIAEGETFPAISLLSYLKEYDRNTVAWSVKGAKHLTISINSGGLLQATTPSPYFNGTDTAIVTVKDVGTAQLFSASDTVVFTVKAADSPVEWLPIAGQTIVEGGTFLPIATKEKALEHDGDHFAVRAEGSDGLSAFLNGDGILTVTPKSKDWFGEETVFLVAQDSSTAQKLESRLGITFKATAVDDAPTLLPIPTIEIPENAVAAAVDLRIYLKEVDGDATVWQAPSTDNLQTQLINGYALTVLKKNPAWNGIDSILVTATDQTQQALSATAYIRFRAGVVTSLADAGISSIHISPNLIQDVLSWEIQTLKPLTIAIALYNLQGVSVFSEEKRLPSVAFWRGNLPVGHLPSGGYVVKICAGDNCFSEKIVKE